MSFGTLRSRTLKFRPIRGPIGATDQGLPKFTDTFGDTVGDAAVIISTDAALAANSDGKVPTEKAVKGYTAPMVLGPGAATANAIALYDGATGKLIKDSATLLSTDGTFAANSDAKVPSEKAIKTYIASATAGLLDLKGSTDCSSNPNYPSALRGDAYYVTTAGKIGGASGKVVAINDIYVASADNAGGDEATVGASWFLIKAPSAANDPITGDLRASLRSTPPSGWIIADDGTIGSASSVATNRANADTAALFAFLWDNFSDAKCPVSSGRGSSASADFALNKSIRLPLMRGRAMVVAGTGASLTPRIMGDVFGEESHVLTVPELPAHNHNIANDANGTNYGLMPKSISGQGTTVGSVDSGGSGSEPNVINSPRLMADTGGGAAHNNMPPSFVGNIFIKL